MSNERESFISLCIKGRCLLEDIDDFIDQWHESDNTSELHEYLGMTLDEYKLWVHQPDILAFVVTAHKRNTSIDKALQSQANYSMAARSDSPENAKDVMQWLQKQDWFVE